MRKDDRTKEERKTHRWLVTATDRFMSGWGQAEGGLSKCAWACTAETVDKVYKWVKSRPEMKHVRITSRPWYPKAKHVHIYVVRNGHRALQREEG